MNRVATKFGKPKIVPGKHKVGPKAFYCGVGIVRYKDGSVTCPNPYGGGWTPEEAYHRWHRAVDPLYRGRWETLMKGRT